MKAVTLLMCLVLVFVSSLTFIAPPAHADGSPLPAPSSGSSSCTVKGAVISLIILGPGGLVLYTLVC